MTAYLLVANILLINLLIASFNTIYNSVNARSLQFWNFQRFSVVLEYEEKPAWPAPFTTFSHIYRLCKYYYRKCKGQNSRFESGLKLFLSKFDLERLYDFEEECVEGKMEVVLDNSIVKGVNSHFLSYPGILTEEVVNMGAY